VNLLNLKFVARVKM